MSRTLLLAEILMKSVFISVWYLAFYILFLLLNRQSKDFKRVPWAKGIGSPTNMLPSIAKESWQQMYAQQQLLVLGWEDRARTTAEQRGKGNCVCSKLIQCSSKNRKTRKSFSNYPDTCPYKALIMWTYINSNIGETLKTIIVNVYTLYFLIYDALEICLNFHC